MKSLKKFCDISLYLSTCILSHIFVRQLSTSVSSNRYSGDSGDDYLLLPLFYIHISPLVGSTPKSRQGLLGSLRDIVLESSRTRVLFTRRSHVEEEEVRIYFTKAITTPASSIEDHIRIFGCEVG